MRKENNHPIVFGAGDHAKVAVATVEAEARYEVMGLLDDDVSKHNLLPKPVPFDLMPACPTLRS
jgi:hypothetical protein